MVPSDIETLRVQTKLSEGLIAAKVLVDGKLKKVVVVGGVPLDFLTFSYFSAKVIAGRPRIPLEVSDRLGYFWESVGYVPDVKMKTTSKISDFLYELLLKARNQMAEEEGKPEYDFLPMFKAVHTAFASE